MSWRGTPGWFTAGDPAGLSGGETSTGLPDGRPGPETHFIGVGGLRLEVQINSGTGRVRIQDESISSQSGSVVLVDEVDGPAGPRIVETLRVEPRFSGGFVDIDIVVRRHPALVPFLRCDARFPDPICCFATQTSGGVHGWQLLIGLPLSCVGQLDNHRCG